MVNCHCYLYDKEKNDSQNVFDHFYQVLLKCMHALTKKK